jgi:orotidine-5'-phosphate decarboxylase
MTTNLSFAVPALNMDMRERLARTAAENSTILCFGVDPDLVRMNHLVTGENRISPFFHPIIEKLLDENAISALKPNYAWFAQYGFDGLYALEDIIQHYRNKVPIILDAKRGDIGKSSEAYAREAYDFWGADAVTISPYMGYDSVAPFVRDAKLAYVLCRTSNKGAEDLQELQCGRKSLYDAVAEKAAQWNCGLVVGATGTAIAKLAKSTKGKVPFLIPGVGAQGGDLEAVMKAIKGNPTIHRINASSSIAYAYEKQGDSPADAALKEAEKLNAVIRKYL